MGTIFMGWSPEQAASMRDQDPAVAEIANQGSKLSYTWLRTHVGRDRDLWKRLGRGKAVLNSTEELDQYLYSYGPMVSCQWKALNGNLSIPPGPIRLIDYGCGQGLAGLLLYEKLGREFSSLLSQIVLTEASAVALIRAEAVYRAIAPNADIVCIRKSFDDIHSNDLENKAGYPTLHVFSNVLDMLGFDHVHLFRKALSPGKHTILAISNDRDVDGGTSRFRDLEARFKQPKFIGSLIGVKSELKTFICGDREQYPVVSWLAWFEVVNG